MLYLHFFPLLFIVFKIPCPFTKSFCIVIVAFFLLLFISFKVIVILNSIQDCMLLSMFMIFLHCLHLSSF